MSKSNISLLPSATIFFAVGFAGGLVISMGIENAITVLTQSLLSDMATWAAFFVASIAGYIAYQAYEEQVETKKITLWRDLAKEFDHEMAGNRSHWGKDYKSGFDATGNALSEVPGPIMDFFETLAYLIRNDQMPPELAKHTFWHAFDAYFRASWKYIKLENATSPDKSIYADILWLHNEWGHDKVLDKHGELEDFFKNETTRWDKNI